MLETRKPPASPRIRPADAPLRPTASRAAAARPRSLGNTAVRSQAVPALRPSPAARPNRLGRSEMRLMGMATACTATVCGLLLLYLAAYAQVTRLGIEQADARGQLRHSLLQNEMLRAERDRLQSPQRVIAAATALGMTPRGGTPVEYIRENAPLQELPGANEQQGMNGGTTADSRTAASFDH